MSKLRPITKKEILDVLEDSYFTAHNFEVTFEEISETKDVLVEIKFVPNKSFKYLIRLPEKRKPLQQANYLTIESPGPHFLEPIIFSHEKFSTCISGIDDWIGRIQEDYRNSNPIYSEIDDLRTSFEAQIKEHVKDSESKFSKEEIQKLQAQLDDLSHKFEKFKKANSITEQGLEEIKEEIAEIRNDLETFPKGVWYRTAGYKILNIFGKFVTSKEGIELVASTTKALISGEAEIK